MRETLAARLFAAAALAAALAALLFLTLKPRPGTQNSPHPVEITEIMSSNSRYPDEDGLFSDWIELHNAGTEPAELAGYALTDNERTARFTFAAGTVLEPDGYLVVPCRQGADGETAAPMGIRRSGGETIFLLYEGAAVARAETIPLEQNESMIPDGNGAWQVCAAPTPGFANTEAGRAAWEASMTVPESPVRITEIMAKNGATLPDGSGCFSDWIELENVSGEDVDLAGWYLSDDGEDPYAWQFPGGAIPSGERLVVFCTGRDGVIAGEIHTGFSLSASGETLILSTPAGKRADVVTFSGAGTDRAWMLSEGEWRLTEDATPGYENTAAGREAFLCAFRPEGLSISEVMTANDSILVRGGAYYDWVELYNGSGREVRLAGLFLTDDLEEFAEHPLPDVTLAPGENLVVFCSGDESLTGYGDWHMGFALNAGEDRLFLTDGEGRLLDYVLLRGIPRRGSMGRMEGEDGWFFFAAPTPGEPNADGFRGVSSAPEWSAPQGVYADAETLSVSLLAPGEIRYTTDGSEPDGESLLYEGEITLTETCVLRAISTEPGKLPSPIATATYLLGVEHTMPVVSLVTDPENLWSAERGIYVAGNHANYMQNWERDASITLFETDGTGFSMECGVKLHGATSRFVTEKKTFKIMLRGIYGDDTLRYDLFGDGEVTSFGSFLLRAGVDEIVPTLIKDSMFGLLAKEGSDHLLSMNHRYCILYLNGEYWGIYALREAMSEEYYASYFDVPPDTVTVTDSSGCVNTDFNTYMNFVRSHDMSLPENYAYVAGHVDVENLIDWSIFEAYSANMDIWNNMRVLGSTAGDGKWRYGLVDLDLTYASESYGFYQTAFQGLHAVIPAGLLENEEYRELFARRASVLLSGVLSDEHVLETIDAMAEELRPEIEMDRERWGGSAETWEANVQRMRDYVSRGRAAWVAEDCAEVLGLTPAQREYWFGEVLG